MLTKLLKLNVSQFSCVLHLKSFYVECRILVTHFSCDASFKDSKTTRRLSRFWKAAMKWLEEGTIDPH